MSQQVQELIDKIKMEGVQAADEKAKAIETSAQTDAQKVIADAKSQAQQIIANANAEAQKIHESTQMALKQAARDTLLALRDEINRTLQKVVAKEIKDTLSSDQLANILIEVIKKSVTENLADDDVWVNLSSKDADSLKDGFAAKLQKEIKGSIKIQSNEDVSKGFTISFDKGKSCFDFTDSSLVEYLTTFLNKQVAALIQEAK